jgi:hypothetical protein
MDKQLVDLGSEAVNRRKIGKTKMGKKKSSNGRKIILRKKKQKKNVKIP